MYHGYIFTVLNIYVYPPHVGQPGVSKPALSNYFTFGLCDGKKRLLILHSDSTSSSIWVNTAFPLNSYKLLDFFPLLKSAWIRALENLHGFSFLSFFFLKFLFPPAPRGLISTSLWFSGTVSHLVLSFQHLFFHCCGHSPSQGSESR